MRWETVKKENGLLRLPESWLHIHYYEAFNILFRLENSLRMFVYIVLKNEMYDRWEEAMVPKYGGTKDSIVNISKMRIAQARSYGYLGYEVLCPIMHLTAGQLTDIILSEDYWKLFEKYFKADKNIIKNKFLEIESIRNSLAHFRPIKAEDIDLVKLNANHLFVNIEPLLIDIFNQRKKVPTNTSDNWYKELQGIKSTSLTIEPLYSKNEDWINVQLTFISNPLSEKRLGKKHIFYQAVKLDSSNILKLHNKLRKYISYLSEHTLMPRYENDNVLIIRKQLYLIFKKNVLLSHSKDILNDIKKLAATTDREYEQLKLDNLARGSLLEVASISCSLNDEDLIDKFNTNPLDCPCCSEDPVEYWGNLSLVTDEVISSAYKYPWMPSEISEEVWF